MENLRRKRHLLVIPVPGWCYFNRTPDIVVKGLIECLEDSFEVSMLQLQLLFIAIMTVWRHPLLNRLCQHSINVLFRSGSYPSLFLVKGFLLHLLCTFNSMKSSLGIHIVWFFNAVVLLWDYCEGEQLRKSFLLVFITEL